MRGSRLPSAVPLPEVPRYTEEVVFGNLGLPQGFDDERLLVNLRGLQRVQAVAGLGTISIVGTTGESYQTDLNISGWDSQGTAVSSGVAKRQKQPLAHGNLRFPNPQSTLFGLPDLTIKVNNSEVDERISEGDFKKGLLDPYARAKYLNGAIKSGLAEASRDANIDWMKAKLTFRYYGLFGGGITLLGGSPDRVFTAAAVFGPVIVNVAILREVTFRNIGQKAEDKDIKSDFSIWKQFRQSLAVGLAIDRWVAGAGLAKATKVIRARR